MLCVILLQIIVFSEIAVGETDITYLLRNLSKQNKQHESIEAQKSSSHPGFSCLDSCSSSYSPTSGSRKWRLDLTAHSFLFFPTLK